MKNDDLAKMTSAVDTADTSKVPSLAIELQGVYNDVPSTCCANSGPAPTAAPTEICEAIVLHGTGVGYDGIFNRMDAQINGFDWWQSRDDVGGVGRNLRVRLFYRFYFELQSVLDKMEIR